MTEQQTPAGVVEAAKSIHAAALIYEDQALLEDAEIVLAAVERLSAEREGLREALEPIARRVVPDYYDDKTLIGWISAGEVRAAQAALTQGESRQTTPAAPTPADGGGE